MWSKEDEDAMVERNSRSIMALASQNGEQIGLRTAESLAFQQALASLHARELLRALSAGPRRFSGGPRMRNPGMPPFRIQLNPDLYSEHSASPLKEADGKVVHLVEDLGRGLWRTDLAVPGASNDGDYVRDGFLMVMPGKDGHFLGKST